MDHGQAIIVDFNVLLFIKDKEGGRPVGCLNDIVFAEFIRKMGGIDMDIIRNSLCETMEGMERRQ